MRLLGCYAFLFILFNMWYFVVIPTTICGHRGFSKQEQIVTRVRRGLPHHGYRVTVVCSNRKTR